MYPASVWYQLPTCTSECSNTQGVRSWTGVAATDAGERVAIERGMVAARRLDLERRADLHVEAAFGARRAVVSTDHPRDQIWQRLREDGSGQTRAHAHVVVHEGMAMAHVRASGAP